MEMFFQKTWIFHPHQKIATTKSPIRIRYLVEMAMVFMANGWISTRKGGYRPNEHYRLHAYRKNGQQDR